MHTLLPPVHLRRSRSQATPSTPTKAYRQPNYDCREQMDALKLVLYVPGVEASGVEISYDSLDLVVTASKAHVVRTNFLAANFESVQGDYQLRLRLGAGFDFEGIRGELHDGLLTLTVPKPATSHGGGAGPRWRAVA